MACWFAYADWDRARTKQTSKFFSEMAEAEAIFHLSLSKTGWLVISRRIMIQPTIFVSGDKSEDRPDFFALA